MALLDVVCTGAREIPDGFTGTEPPTAACGARFQVEIPAGDPGLTDTWDVQTDGNGEIVRYHKSIICPVCGTFTWRALTPQALRALSPEELNR